MTTTDTSGPVKVGMIAGICMVTIKLLSTSLYRGVRIGGGGGSSLCGGSSYTFLGCPLSREWSFINGTCCTIIEEIFVGLLIFLKTKFKTGSNFFVKPTSYVYS